MVIYMLVLPSECSLLMGFGLELLLLDCSTLAEETCAGVTDCVVCVLLLVRELQHETSLYTLRRTQEVLSKHLPPLDVHTIFASPVLSRYHKEVEHVNTTDAMCGSAIPVPPVI